MALVGFDGSVALAAAFLFAKRPMPGMVDRFFDLEIEGFKGSTKTSWVSVEDIQPNYALTKQEALESSRETILVELLNFCCNYRRGTKFLK